MQRNVKNRLGEVSYSVQRTFKVLQGRSMALDQHSGKVHYPRQDEVRALQAPSAHRTKGTRAQIIYKHSSPVHVTSETEAPVGILSSYPLPRKNIHSYPQHHSEDKNLSKSQRWQKANTFAIVQTRDSI